MCRNIVSHPGEVVAGVIVPMKTTESMFYGFPTITVTIQLMKYVVAF